MVTLHFVTLGFSDIYWSYRQWRAHQATHGRPIMPLLRAWFMAFYTHTLFRSVDARARAVGAESHWRPNSQAWVFVGLLVCESLASRVYDESASAIAIWLICHTLRVFPMITAQRLSNEAHALAWSLQNEADDEEEDDEDEDDEEDDEEVGDGEDEEEDDEGNEEEDDEGNEEDDEEVSKA